jgi:hypothetical protein
MATGNAGSAPKSFGGRIKMMLKRSLSPKTKRRLKLQYAKLWSRFEKPRAPTTDPVAERALPALAAGDRVRVRSRAEIQATLNVWDELRGCGFMPEMWQYCGTVQRVLKPVKQFLDERDYQLKKCGGVVLLENVMCCGMEEYGPCDRSCFFFWRVEWLEKLP